MSVSIYYLEMTTPQQLCAKTEAKGLVISEAQINEYRLNKFLYQLIGEQWQWHDKLSESDQAWQHYVDNPHLHTWVAYYRGTIAGYFELQHDPHSGDTEIVYFGLAPQFIGQGFGGYLLSQAIQRAWEISGTTRVWVHTCSLDHQSALLNYQARGFRLYKTELQPS